MDFSLVFKFIYCFPRGFAGEGGIAGSAVQGMLFTLKSGEFGLASSPNLSWAGRAAEFQPRLKVCGIQRCLF